MDTGSWAWRFLSFESCLIGRGCHNYCPFLISPPHAHLHLPHAWHGSPIGHLLQVPKTCTMYMAWFSSGFCGGFTPHESIFVRWAGSASHGGKMRFLKRWWWLVPLVLILALGGFGTGPAWQQHQCPRHCRRSSPMPR